MMVARHEVPGTAIIADPSRRERSEELPLICKFGPLHLAEHRRPQNRKSYRSLRDGTCCSWLPGTSYLATIIASLRDHSDPRSVELFSSNLHPPTARTLSPTSHLSRFPLHDAQNRP